MYHEDRVNLHAFEGESTMKNDYRLPSPEFQKQYHIYKWNTDLQDDFLNVKSAKIKHECNESFTKLRDDVYVPFNLLWTPKPIIDTRKVSRKIFVKPVDCGKEESIRNRPRIYMGPAVCIDDIEDRNKRNLILEYMYTTQFRNSERDINTFRALNKKEKNVCCCAVTDEKNTGEYEYMVNDMESCVVRSPEETKAINISPYMREKYYKEWDNHQKRACVNPTDYFWNHTDIPKNIHVGDGLITPEMKKEISELIRIDKLRIPHDLPKPGYCGHKVEVATGVPLRKRDFPASHPMMTTQQTLNCHYEEDMMSDK